MSCTLSYIPNRWPHEHLPWRHKQQKIHQGQHIYVCFCKIQQKNSKLHANYNFYDKPLLFNPILNLPQGQATHPSLKNLLSKYEWRLAIRREGITLKGPCQTQTWAKVRRIICLLAHLSPSHFLRQRNFRDFRSPQIK